jgi:hypothetical protein
MAQHWLAPGISTVTELAHADVCSNIGQSCGQRATTTIDLLTSLLCLHTVLAGSAQPTAAVSPAIPLHSIFAAAISPGFAAAAH